VSEEIDGGAGDRREGRSGAPKRGDATRAACAASALALALLWPAVGGGAEIEGVQFEDTVVVGGQRLRINGTGLREVYIVKTWVAALYTPQAVQSGSALIAGTGARRIAITLLTEVSIDHVARGLLDAVRRNHDPILLATIEPQIELFVTTLRSIGPTEKGDTLALDMARGATRVSFNGMAVGEPISGLLFRDALLRAFVGDQPVDEALKRGLLGLPLAGG
jgi:hypothetical protein